MKFLSRKPPFLNSYLLFCWCMCFYWCCFCGISFSIPAAVAQGKVVPPREWTDFPYPAWSNNGRFVAVTWPASDRVLPDGTVERIEKIRKRRDKVIGIVCPTPPLPQKNSSGPFSFMPDFGRLRTIVLDARSHEKLFPSISDYLNDISWSPNDQYIAGCGHRQSGASVYEVKTGSRILKLPNAGSFDACVWSPDGNRLAVSQELWDFKRRCLQHRMDSLDGLRIGKIVWAPNGNQIAVFGRRSLDEKGKDTGELQVLETDNGRVVFRRQSKIGIGNAGWTQEGKWFVYSDGALHFLDPSTFTESFTLEPDGRLGPVEFSLSNDKSLLAYKGSDPILHIFDVAAKKIVAEISGDRSGNFGFKWAPDNRNILIESNQCVIAICDARSGIVLGSKRLDNFVSSWTPTGDALVTVDGSTESVVLEKCDLSLKGEGKSVLIGGTQEDPWKNQRVPQNLEDCFAELKMIFGPEQIEVFKNTEEAKLCNYTGGPGLGMQLRNLWGLRQHTPLVEYFNKNGVTDGAEMSSIIIESYWRKLNGKTPLDIPEQVQYHREQRTKMWQSAPAKSN